MIAMLFVAGPAVALAILAWAVDRFTPVPVFKREDVRPGKDETARQMLARAVIPPSTADGCGREFNALRDAEGLVHFNQALDKLLDNRRKYRDSLGVSGEDSAEAETSARTKI